MTGVQTCALPIWDTSDIIRLRIVEFDSLDVGFREKLDKAGGIIKVEERQASRLG